MAFPWNILEDHPTDRGESPVVSKSPASVDYTISTI